MHPLTFPAIIGGAVTVLLLAGGWAIAAGLSTFNGLRYENEIPSFNPADEERWAEYRRTGDLPPAVEPARVGVGERVTRAGYLLAIKVLRLDRTGAGR